MAPTCKQVCHSLASKPWDMLQICGAGALKKHNKLLAATGLKLLIQDKLGQDLLLEYLAPSNLVEDLFIFLCILFYLSSNLLLQACRPIGACFWGSFWKTLLIGGPKTSVSLHHMRNVRSTKTKKLHKTSPLRQTWRSLFISMRFTCDLDVFFGWLCPTNGLII